ncbi:MAG: NYN domain-containing protein [Bacillota bacterium]
MKHYIIDGNNLIGKIKTLFLLQKKDGQASREKLVLFLESFFHDKKAKISLCFDGFPQLAIRTSKIKIYYSENKPADDIIKNLIENSKNPKVLVVVSSDHNLMQFARVCHCEVKSSEEFSKEIAERKLSDEEDEKKKSISNDEVKKLFGI